MKYKYTILSQKSKSQKNTYIESIQYLQCKREKTKQRFAAYEITRKNVWGNKPSNSGWWEGG